MSTRLHDLDERASTLRDIADTHFRSQEYRKSLEFYEKARRVFHSFGNKREEAYTLSRAALVHSKLGEGDKAVELSKKSLEIAREAGGAFTEAQTLSQIAESYERMGRYEDAVKYCEKSLIVGQDSGDEYVQSAAQIEMARMYRKVGLYQKAMDLYNKSLEKGRRRGSLTWEAIILTDVAGLCSSLGQHDKALEVYGKVLELYRQAGGVDKGLRALQGIGATYQALGEYEKSLAFYEKALDICRKTADRQNRANTLSDMVRVYQRMGKHGKAIELGEEAAAIYRRLGVKNNRMLADLANSYLAQGRIIKAEDVIRNAHLVVLQGRYRLKRDDYLDAKRWFERALDLAGKNRRLSYRFAGNTGMGLVYEGLHWFHAAERYFGQAVEVLEEIRESLPEAQRRNFLSLELWDFAGITPYEGLARVLLKSGKHEESLAKAEATRARVFSEALSQRFGSVSVDIPQEILEADLNLNNRVAALVKALQEAYEKGDSVKIDSFQEQLKVVRSERDAHIDKLRKDYPLYAVTKYPTPMRWDQSALRDDEWVLEYEVTDPGICIYLIHGRTIEKAFFKSIPRKELDELVRTFRDPLEVTEPDIHKKLKTFDLASGKKLSDVLLSDILPGLPEGTPVIVVPDDSLGVLPFEMLVLNEGGRVTVDGKCPAVQGAAFFGDRNRISYYQSITALTLARTFGKLEKTAKKRIVMADPVFGREDARLQAMERRRRIVLLKSLPDKLMSIKNEIGLTFPRLPLTGELGETLKELDPKLTDLYMGMKASKPILLNKSLDGYGSMVFATHGYFGKDLPGIQEPVLILALPDQPKGQDGFLRMSEVMGLKLNADVVALTACQTGLGRRLTGEGTMGMGRAFQYAGAKAVLMSLWSVSEKSSVKLVESFFRHLKEGVGKLDALRLARNEIRDAGYDHPFFWAGFILAGEVK